MKGANRRMVLDKIEDVLMDNINTNVAALRTSYPSESIPDIRAVYRDEEDYDKVVKRPCLLMFSYGPEVLEAMSNAYLYEYMVDICAYDDPDAKGGLPALYNRLYMYQGCLTDVLISDYSYVQGYWSGVRALEPVDPSFLADERFGTIGRVEGYRYGFQTALSYGD